ELVAERIEQYVNPEKTELFDAELLFHEQTSEPWQIKADYTLLTAQKEQIEFSGNVQLYRAATATQRETTVITESFTWWPYRKYGETTKEIVLLQPGLEIQGQGATIDMHSQKIELLTGVQVDYDPKVV